MIWPAATSKQILGCKRELTLLFQLEQNNIEIIKWNRFCSKSNQQVYIFCGINNNKVFPGWRGNKITRSRNGAKKLSQWCQSDCEGPAEEDNFFTGFRGKAQRKPFCHGRQCDSSFYRSRVRILCFAEKVLERISPNTFISHTKMSIIFETGRSTDYIAWKPMAVPNKQSSYSFLRLNKWKIYQFKLLKHWQKSTFNELKANYDTETNTSDIEKIPKCRKQPELLRWGKKVTQLKKLEYLRVTHAFKYPIFSYLFFSCVH